GDDPVATGDGITLALLVPGANGADTAKPAVDGLVVRWDGDRWANLVAPPTVKAGSGPVDSAEQRLAKIVGTSENHLWFGFDYEHRFREYSPAGKLLTEVVEGQGGVRRAADAEASQA